MRIAVVGAGASGIFYALVRKHFFPQDDIVLFEKEAKIGRKIYATGNGKCNLAHTLHEEDFTCYRYPDIAKALFDEVPLKTILTFFQDLGVDLQCVDETLWYPRTESARTVMDVFQYQCRKQGILIETNMPLINYKVKEKKVVLQLFNKEEMFDYLVLATGGCAAPQLGSDGNLFPILRQHQYHVTELAPGLVGMKVKEDTHLYAGQRIKCQVRLVQNQTCLFEEYGEVLIKEDGLSGIVIFNAASYLMRHHLKQAQICLDLFPDFTPQTLYQHLLDKEKKGYPYLDGIVATPLAREIERRTQTKGHKSKEEWKRVVAHLKSFTFTFQDTYSFHQAQVMIGGIAIDQVDSYFISRFEKRVILLGEMLDMDGFCGGYNLMWAWASAYRAATAKLYDFGKEGYNNE